jgi:hypothetical protein
MKYCPTCGTRFDEEIMRFCTKDGTPLIDEEKPNFSTLPSASVPAESDEFDELTVIRRNVPVPPPRVEDEEDFSEPSRPAERIVIPTVDDRPRERVRTASAYNPPPRPSTFKVVVLTILGTLAVLGMGGLAFMFLQKDRGSNRNNNLNSNQNINTNVNAFDANFNFNGFTSTPPSSNVNANLKTPTPTPKPTPSASPSETPTATPTPEHSGTPTPSPSPGGTVSPSPRPTDSPDGRPRVTTSPTATVPTPRPAPRVVISPANRPD